MSGVDTLPRSLGGPVYGIGPGECTEATDVGSVVECDSTG